MTIKEAIEFGKEQMEIFGEDCQMGKFIRLAILTWSIDTKDDYYHLDNMPDNKCIVKFKEDYKKCGNCRHLIFKDFKHQEGLCDLTRLHRCFYDLCVHDEDIM